LEKLQVAAKSYKRFFGDFQNHQKNKAILNIFGSKIEDKNLSRSTNIIELEI